MEVSLKRIILSISALIIISLSASSDDNNEPYPIPNKADLDKAFIELHEKYDKLTLKSPTKERLRYARTLWCATTKNELNPAAKFVLFEHAISIAFLLGDLRFAHDLEKDAIKTFKISIPQLTLRIINDSKFYLNKKQQSLAALSGFRYLANNALLSEDYSLAEDMMKKALSYVKNKNIKKRYQAMLEILDIFTNIIAEDNNKNSNTTDLLLGSYWCLLCNDWINGKNILARTAEPNIKAAAMAEQEILPHKEINERNQIAKAVELGNLWFKASKSFKPKDLKLSKNTINALKKAMEYRSSVWYERIIPKLTNKEFKKEQKLIASRLKKTPDLMTRLIYQESNPLARIRGTKGIEDKINKDPANWHLLEARDERAANLLEYEYVAFNKLAWSWHFFDDEEDNYQSNIVFKNDIMHGYALDCKGARIKPLQDAIKTLKENAEKYPYMKHKSAACIIKIGDLYIKINPPQKREAVIWYNKVLSMGSEVQAYIDIAKERLNQLNQ